MKKKLTLTLLATFICAATAIKTTTFAMESINQPSKITLPLNEQIKLEDDLETIIDNVKSNIAGNIDNIKSTLRKIKFGERTMSMHNEINNNIKKMELCNKEVLNEIDTLLKDLSNKFGEHIDVENVTKSLNVVKTLVENLGVSINKYKIFNDEEFNSHIERFKKFKKTTDSLNDNLKELQKKVNPSENEKDEIEYEKEKIMYRKKIMYSVINTNDYTRDYGNYGKLEVLEKELSSLTEQILEETKKIKFVKKEYKTNDDITDMKDKLNNLSGEDLEEYLMDFFTTSRYTTDEKLEKIKKLSDKELLFKFLAIEYMPTIGNFISTLEPKKDDKAGLDFIKKCTYVINELSPLEQAIEEFDREVLNPSKFNYLWYEEFLEKVKETLDLAKKYLKEARDIEDKISIECKNKSNEEIKSKAKEIFNQLSMERESGHIKDFDAKIDTRDEQISLIARYEISLKNFEKRKVDRLLLNLEDLDKFMTEHWL